MSQLLRGTPPLLLILLLSAACSSAPPPFEASQAQEELGELFEVDPRRVSVLSDGPAPGGLDEWWVDFRVPQMRQTLQARYVAGDGAWGLDGLRQRRVDGEAPAWGGVEDILGVFEEDGARKAEETMRMLEELGGAIEALAVSSGNVYPQTSLSGLGDLMRRGGYLEAWRHERDGWGNPIHYYATDTGQAYILVSAGGDQRFDEPLTAYELRTERSDFAYDGASSNLDRDIIFAVGSLVQRYRPTP